MIEYYDGKIDLDKIEIADVIDIQVLQDFLDNFALGMNCAAVSVDRTGAEVTRPSYYRDFCQKFIHVSEYGDQQCAQCHNEFGEEAVKQGRPYVGQCHAGLIDFAAPIIIENHHIGTVLGGQILDQEPRQDTINGVARDLKFDEEKLWEAAKRIDVVPKRNIEAAAQVLYVVVNSLASSGIQRLEIEKRSQELVENFLQISQTIDMLAQSAQTITASQQNLGSEINEINELTIEINSILDAIAKVTNKTKLIGINASIEAARLGTEGLGFSVVAKEIQALSDTTRQTTIEIAELNKKITDKISLTIGNSNQTLSITEDQSAAMEELAAAVQSSVEIAEKLRNQF